MQRDFIAGDMNGKGKNGQYLIDVATHSIVAGMKSTRTEMLIPVTSTDLKSHHILPIFFLSHVSKAAPATGNTSTWKNTLRETFEETDNFKSPMTMLSRCIILENNYNSG
jgi:hypothetical protein